MKSIDGDELRARLEQLELRISELELQALQGGVYRNSQGAERSLRDALSWLSHLTPVVRRLYWAIKESSIGFNIPDRQALDKAADGLDVWQVPMVVCMNPRKKQELAEQALAREASRRVASVHMTKNKPLQRSRRLCFPNLWCKQQWQG